MVTDAQIAAVTRYALGNGTVRDRIRLTYVLLLANYHRRAGKETYEIQLDAFVDGKYRNHGVIVVRHQTTAKTGNFDKSCRYIQKEDVMISCPTTIALVRWLRQHAQHCNETAAGNILWHQAVDPKATVADLAPGVAVLHKGKPYKQVKKLSCLY